MKRMLCFAVVLSAVSFLLTLCSTQETLRPGDLVFVGIPADYSLDSDSMESAISAATGSGALNLIHVAIVDVDEQGVWIIDATIKHGVDRHPLSTFLEDFTLKDGSYPVFMVKRLRDDAGAEGFVEAAKAYLGQQYDSAFLPDNGASYCTELVYNSYRRPDGSPIFSAAPMNFRDAEGNMPVYWEQLFALLGMPVPQGIDGTNPQAMAAEQVLRDVDVDLVSLAR